MTCVLNNLEVGTEVQELARAARIVVGQTGSLKCAVFML